mmetsp:Transcript_29071/g.67622  ORF Transcript_29071/g.67622 Transcript_29071/m.67622 type:complete len:639 (+) Transcript_29071:52-1968(+)
MLALKRVPGAEELRCMLPLGWLWPLALAMGMLRTTASDFHIQAASELQEVLFGSSARNGWLGGHHVSSFPTSKGGHVWMFGDSFMNVTTKKAKPEGDELAQCNYFPSRNCAMPTNSFATRSRLGGPLMFHPTFDSRSGRPTSALWPPGWGSIGNVTKTPSCKGCSLWASPTLLSRSPEQCAAAAQGLEMDKGGCCSTVAAPCPGYCCHNELYFSGMAGMAHERRDEILVMARMSKGSKLMPRDGQTFGTYAVVISNAGAPPQEWTYSSHRMPDTHVWPWSDWDKTKQFFSAICAAEEPTQPNLVYLLGFMGHHRVLARANLTDLLNFTWSNVQFWGPQQTWCPYEKHETIPKLAALWELESEEVSLHYDKRIGKWVVPEVRSSDKVVLFRLSSSITGPYRTLILGRVPNDAVLSELVHWDVGSVKNHPELASGNCLWVLSIVFYWKSQVTPPPQPGLHHFPRLLCVTGSLYHVRHSASKDPDDKATLPVKCTADVLQRIAGNLACDPSSGCHSCRARASHLQHSKSISLAESYRLVAVEFAEVCSAFSQCPRKVAALQRWDAVAGGKANAVQLTGQLAPVLVVWSMLLVPAALIVMALLRVNASRGRRLLCWERRSSADVAGALCCAPQPLPRLQCLA